MLLKPATLNISHNT